MSTKKDGAGPRVDPSKIQLRNSSGIPQFSSCREAAVHWYGYDFGVIPVVPGTKRTAVKWDPWINELSPESIESHWSRHSDHELGFVVGEYLLVLDADTEDSLAAIEDLCRRFGVEARLIHKTAKGEHHFFRRAKGTYAKADSHDSNAHPDRLDVRTGRSLVVLPPSEGKSIRHYAARHASELDEVGQDFIDAVAHHNGRQPPRLLDRSCQSVCPRIASDQRLLELQALLDHLDPDVGYEDWLHVGMALFHETQGSDEGLALFDAWSGRGTKYQGFQEIQAKWDSFRPDEPNPITVATLRRMVEDGGHDWLSVCDGAGPQFEILETPTVLVSSDAEHSHLPVTGLDQYSLRGRSQELERLAIESVPVLGQLALKGQATVIYASPNTGKTLLTLHLLIEAILAGLIDPDRLYFLNMDDTHKGILEKLRIAEEYRFHLLAEGHRDFSANLFLAEIERMIENDQARGVIVVLDTLKKFVNLMDKSKASGFTKVIRRFVMAGGTVMALSHSNKNPGPDGKPRYGGVSDVVDDFDAAHTISVVTPRDEAGFKVVEFENFKRRGNIVDSAAYRYDPTPHDSYLELLLSVESVDPMQLTPIKQIEQQRTDAEIIEPVKACIRDGITTRMKLAKAVMQRTRAPRRAVLAVLDRYGDEHSEQQLWRYSIGARGGWVYEILDPEADPKLPSE